MSNFHLVLYRKYRPQNFNEVMGQSHITEILKKAVSVNKISHSYLFSGPKGTGKTSMARILAKAVNCETRDNNTEYEPCNKCASCEETTNGKSLDLIEIDAASNRGIDEIRALREAARLNPLKSKYRVYIIDEVHMLTKEAFNALLKTLEEPPRHIIFILATTEFDKIPETIISRCEQYKFKKMTDDIVKLSLKKIADNEKIKIEEGALTILSILAEGSLRDAHSKLEQMLDFEKREITDLNIRAFFGLPKETATRDFIESLIEKDFNGAFKIASDIQKEGVDSKIFIKLVLRNLRFLMIMLISPIMENEIKQITTEKEIEFIKNLKSKTNVLEIENMIKVFLNAYSSTLFSHFPELPLEMALAEISKNI